MRTWRIHILLYSNSTIDRHDDARAGGRIRGRARSRDPDGRAQPSTARVVPRTGLLRPREWIRSTACGGYRAPGLHADGLHAGRPILLGEFRRVAI
jgi:hypothetical protein